MSDEKFSLKVIFSGVSTHFRNGIVAGIPHRAVLPDCSHFFTDFLSIDGFPDPFLYYLNPHFAQLQADGVDFTIPGLMTKNGYVRSGVRLQVGNGIPAHGLRATDSSMNNLTTYDPSYEYSADVVVGGRAACYFDFDYGDAEWLPPEPPSILAQRLSVTVETDGPPWLLVTSLNATADAPSFTKLELGGSRHVTLDVKNLELHSEEPADQNAGQFDFLFHFLTARGGIPKRIVVTTPGLESPSSASGGQIASALKDLAALLTLQAKDPAAFYEKLPPLAEGQTPACSPAQYG